MESLTRNNIPVAVRGERGTVLDEQPGRLVLCFIRLLTDPRDDLALRTIFCHLGRRNGIGEATIAEIIEFARAEGFQFGEACRAIAEQPDLIGRGGYLRTELSFVDSTLHIFSDITNLRIADGMTAHESRVIRQKILGGLEALATQLIKEQDHRDEVVRYVKRSAVRYEFWSYCGFACGPDLPRRCCRARTRSWESQHPHHAPCKGVISKSSDHRGSGGSAHTWRRQRGRIL